MSIVLDGTSGITTPEIVSTGGPLVVNASAPDNSVVVDASGNVGIGTSSPGARLHSTSAPGTVQVRWSDGTNGTASLDTVSGASRVYSNVALAFGTGSESFAERMRIDSSGNLLLGTTSDTPTGQNALALRPGGSRISRDTTLSRVHFEFLNPNGLVGSISTSGSATAYNTSSDYRLKHDIQPMTGALAKVALLKPCTYKWNADNSEDEGFIAHELQEVCPSAVTGEKDAVDAEGNPQYQGIDTSFLVATLTAALQELKAINDAQAQTIKSLTARVVALEQA